MTRVDPGGADPVGIGPRLLPGMTSQVNSAAGDALNLVYGYLGQLSRVGLDTGGLTRAVRDLAGPCVRVAITLPPRSLG